MTTSQLPPLEGPLEKEFRHYKDLDADRPKQEAMVKQIINEKLTIAENESRLKGKVQLLEKDKATLIHALEEAGVEIPNLDCPSLPTRRFCAAPVETSAQKPTKKDFLLPIVAALALFATIFAGVAAFKPSTSVSQTRITVPTAEENGQSAANKISPQVAAVDKKVDNIAGSGIQVLTALGQITTKLTTLESKAPTTEESDKLASVQAELAKAQAELVAAKENAMDTGVIEKLQDQIALLKGELKQATADWDLVEQDGVDAAGQPVYKLTGVNRWKVWPGHDTKMWGVEPIE